MPGQSATQAQGSDRPAVRRVRDAVPITVAIIVPWTLMVAGLLALSAGLRFRQYSADALVVIGLVAAPVIAGLTIVFLHQRARVAWPIAVGTVIAGLIGGAFETGIIDEACVRVPTAIWYVAMTVPGALWFASTGIIVAWVAGTRRSAARGAGAFVVGAAITIPVLVLCVLLGATLQSAMVDNSLRIVCSHLL